MPPMLTFRPSIPAAVLGILVPLLASGCSESQVTRPDWTEILLQNPPTEVDILMIVDDSGSMGDEQDELGEGFDRFVEFFDVAEIDYHIGVTTTDVEGRGGGLVQAGDHKVITRETPEPAETFDDLVNVGVQGSGYEQGLAAARLALTETMREGDNAGFFRDEALLSVIFVSDEEDASLGPTREFINGFRELKGQRRRDAFNASALIGFDAEASLPADCNQGSGQTGVGAVAGWRYWDVAHQSDGVVGSICEEDFSDLVSRMGLAASRLRDRFLLERRANPESIELDLVLDGEAGEGTRVPPDGVDGEWAWVYEEVDGQEGGQIRFTDLGSIPPVGSHLVVRYEGP